MLDINLFFKDKGGDPELVRASQRQRYADVKVVDEVIQLYEDWKTVRFQLDQQNKQLNVLQKSIGQRMKAKEDASELLTEKSNLEKEKLALIEVEKEREKSWKLKLATIGNLVHSSVPVNNNEDFNDIIKTWSPAGKAVEKRTDILAHSDVMHRIDAFDLERGAKVSGHRGYFLANDGVDLNLALIMYGLQFLAKKGYKKLQTPFMMLKDVMAKTAQLEQFDEELYKVVADGDDRYLIATSEQPISAFHSDEWFEKTSETLPVRYAGYSTCFRKEAGAHGRDTWGIFRVHQFEKVEQFCLTDPEKSWEMLEEMLGSSEEFYQSLGLSYRVVVIVSGALNNAAAKKYDLEAWFPFQGAYKELVSCSNCTDYQSRRLEIRCGAKKLGDREKRYVHCLNATLCATERTLCCIAENYQTPDGLVIPEVLRPYMGGRDFIPFVKAAPKTAKKA